jgi:glycosyltransferase involved in cell wall biosynthesis
MKILIATPYFYPRVGGLENYARALAEGLAEAGHRVVVVCGDQVPAVTKQKQGGINIYRLPIWLAASNTPINPLWYWYLRRIIKDEQPDIINAHTPVPFMVDMAAAAAGRRVPLVVTYHAATLFKPGSALMRLATWLYTQVERLTLRRARSIFAVSEYVKQSLRPGLREKTFVMPNATYLVDQAKPRPHRGLVFVNNLDASHSWKGLDLILESLAISMSQPGKALRLTVIGDGNDRARYEAKARELGIGHLVTFAGRLVGDERNRLMGQAQALVAYPTTANDAFPTVFLEAWSLGLPVIAAAIGPMPTLIEDGRSGVLVPSGDAGVLAVALVRAMANPAKLRAMGRYGRGLVETEYNWPTQVARAGELLELLS